MSSGEKTYGGVVRPMISHADVRETFKYDAKTGAFIWSKPSRYRPDMKGKKAGSWIVDPRDGRRSLRVKVSGHFYYVSRLIVFYVTGCWPQQHVDHIDGDASNNRWVNLRETAEAENQMNKRRYKNNSTGHKGVDVLHGKFRARIQCRRKSVHLGFFDTAKAASKAYEKAAKKHFKEYRRG